MSEVMGESVLSRKYLIIITNIHEICQMIVIFGIKL